MRYEIGYQILAGMSYFFRIINLALLAYCVMSFFARGTKLFALLDRLIAPLRRPFMPLTMWMAQRGFPFDLSIIFIYIALSLVQSLLTQIVYIFMGVW